MKQNYSISVLGCGWLGLPLALELQEMGYHRLKGSSTSEAKLKLLKDLDIEPYLIEFNPGCHPDSIKEFLRSDILIINIPPSVRTQGEDFHILQMENLRDYIAKSSIKRIIYISSTSVYPDLNREVTEEDVLLVKEAENKTLFKAEELFRNLHNQEATILRCGGLAGYDRNLVKYFAGKRNLKMGNTPVNLIHRDDVIGIILTILKKDFWNDTLNICAPEHPIRKIIYPYLAAKYNYPTPHYIDDDQSPFKIVSTEKLKAELNYSFKFPDPHHFPYNS